MKQSEKEHSSAISQQQALPGIFIGARTLSWITASACMVFFFSFFTGYFLGQKRAIARFTHKLDQDSFADQIYAALCGMDNATELAQNDDTATNDDDSLRISTATEEQSAISPTASETDPLASSAVTDTAQEQAAVEEGENSSQDIVTRYYAQLAGFGTAKAAQRWTQRLQKKGIPVFVKKRSSRSARGTLISWYQVVTERFQDKAKLEELVATIAREEKVSDIHLVTC